MQKMAIVYASLISVFLLVAVEAIIKKKMRLVVAVLLVHLRQQVHLHQQFPVLLRL